MQVQEMTGADTARGWPHADSVTKPYTIKAAKYADLQWIAFLARCVPYILGVTLLSQWTEKFQNNSNAAKPCGNGSAHCG